MWVCLFSLSSFPPLLSSSPVAMRFSFLLCLQLAAAMMAITLATSHAVNAGAVEANGATYNAGAAAASSSSSSNVQLKYYVEAYCARCIDVLTNSLVDAMRRVGDIVDLEVIPFGNGSENGGVITCQHGAKECHANTLQGCAMVHYPKTKQWFGFIVCMEKQTDPLHAAKWCAGKHKIDFNKIEACAMVRRRGQ